MYMKNHQYLWYILPTYIQLYFIANKHLDISIYCILFDTADVHNSADQNNGKYAIKLYTNSG